MEISHNNIEINYRLAGSGNITLLFIHGSYTDQDYWNEQVDFFSPHYQVVTLDLPAHGKSGKERKHWSIKDFADDVIYVIRTLNLENVILIGHSIAGDINLMVATSYPAPIIGFIGIDNFRNAATPLPEQYHHQAETIMQNLKTDFAKTNEQYAQMALLTEETPPRITTRVTEDFAHAYEPMGIEIMTDIFNMYKREKKLLPLIKVKLYLINVDYRPTNEEPLKEYAGRGYELLHMHGTCHFPMLENPGELNHLIQETIDKIAAQELNTYA